MIINLDTSRKSKTIWITDNKIFLFDDMDSASCGLYNFETNILNIKEFGRSHYNNMKEGRLKAIISESKDFKGLRLEVNDIVHDIIYVDTSIHIPFLKSGGFGGSLDNGLGFLPVRTERKYIDEENNLRTTITTLVSKKTKLIDTNRFNID